jgi:DNA repair protein RecN (Recombination protein N)
MLKNLLIQNIILVEHADIPFNLGFNIITGETGSGKSAIMHGLSLAVGDRTDTTLIRKGCDKGIIEAVFDIDGLDHIISFLTDGGIEHQQGQDLIIRREISVSGKNRLFINHQQAQHSFLRQLGQQLVQMVGQHANQRLLSTDYHRTVLDLYGDLEPLITQYKHSYGNENCLRKKLETLIQQESARLRDIDISQAELDELEDAQIKPNEDEELFAEYSLLSNSKELREKAEEIVQAFSGSKQSVLVTLNRQKQVMESLAELDNTLKESSQALTNSYLELQEILHTMRHYQNKLHHDPERLERVNERLTLINKLKRKYGPHLVDVMVYLESTRQKLKSLLNADIEIEETQSQLEECEQKTNELSKNLTAKREQIAKELSNEMTKQLHSLNMKKAEFLVQVTPQKRTNDGNDKVEFFLIPNVGEHQISLKDGASGGEISRVLLSLQTIMAGKENTPTLIFDEVDANIGGETASIVGSKLNAIGLRHQVICITHFPQVACQASHHLQISKEEKLGRTITEVKELNSSERQNELDRMGGKNSKLELLEKNPKFEILDIHSKFEIHEKNSKYEILEKNSKFEIRNSKK